MSPSAAYTSVDGVVVAPSCFGHGRAEAAVGVGQRPGAHLVGAAGQPGQGLAELAHRGEEDLLTEQAGVVEVAGVGFAVAAVAVEEGLGARHPVDEHRVAAVRDEDDGRRAGARASLERRAVAGDERVGHDDDRDASAAGTDRVGGAQERLHAGVGRAGAERTARAVGQADGPGEHGVARTLGEGRARRAPPESVDDVGLEARRGERPPRGLGCEREHVLVRGADGGLAPPAAAPGRTDFLRVEAPRRGGGPDREQLHTGIHDPDATCYPRPGTKTPIPSGNARPLAIVSGGWGSPPWKVMRRTVPVALPGPMPFGETTRPMSA